MPRSEMPCCGECLLALVGAASVFGCCISDGVEMWAFKACYSRFYWRVKIAVRKEKFPGYRMLRFVIVEDVLEF